MHCPGSVAAEAGLPDTSSPAAREGTDAHEIAASVLRKAQVSCDGLAGLDFEEVTGKKSVSGITAIKPEMTAHLNVYIRAVWNAFGAWKDDAEILIEQRLSLETIRKGMFGTGDVVILKRKAKILELLDLKYGIGKIVEVEDNEQLRYYGLAALMHFPDAEIETVKITIVQPRAPHPAGPVRSIEFPAMMLIEWMFELAAAAEATADPNAPKCAGSWCGFCKAAPTCNEFRHQARKAALDGFGDVVEPSTLSPAEIGKRLAEADLLAAWIKSIKAHADKEARAGNMPSGFKWVAGRGSRSWKQDHDKTIALIEEKTGLDVSQRICPSVAETEKLLGKALFKPLADELVTKSPGKPTLAKEGDKRPAISIDDVNKWKTEGFDDVEAE